jgi:hypothetical protein
MPAYGRKNKTCNKLPAFGKRMQCCIQFQAFGVRKACRPDLLKGCRARLPGKTAGQFKL